MRAEAQGLVVVVPCYNEAARFDADAFLSFLQRTEGKLSFVFVDDGSTDRTGVILEALAARRPVSIRVLHLEKNSGKAEAVRRGLLHALEQNGPAFAGYWDADLATPLDAIDDLRELLETRPEVEVVIGSRVKLLGNQIGRSAKRHYLGRVFATAASVALGIAVYDTQCGAKLFRVNDHLRHVLRLQFGSTWSFDVELIARYLEVYRRTGNIDVDARIVEVPLKVWREVPGSKVKPTDFFVALRDIAKVALKYR